MVSVIIPNYNHAQYLEQRIESVLKQVYQDFELIILDDNSTDCSQDIIEKYRSHPKVSFIIYNKENSGSTFKQWNKGISLAVGEYIWIAESDDIADPLLLGTLVSNIQQQENIVLSYSNSYRINSIGEVTSKWDYKVPYNQSVSCFSNDFRSNGRQFIQNFLIFKNVIPNASAVLFSKKAFLEVGGADENVHFCADWLVWLKLLTIGDVIYSQKPLNNFRYHATSVIATASQKATKVFLKKYDIVMRQMYMCFLKEKYVDLSELMSYNSWYLTQDILDEIAFLFSKQKYFLSFCNYIKLLEVSENKMDVIKYPFKVLNSYMKK